MWGESGRSIRAVMGFDCFIAAQHGRAGIAEGRLYLRSRFGLRNHQFAINRTGVQRYGVDETRPIALLVYQRIGSLSKD
jgi:hypothetical protein